MIELKQTEFYRIVILVSPITFNINFANSVLLNHVKGRAFVDNYDNPQSAYILHPYGMSLLAGFSSNIDYQNEIISSLKNENGERKRDEWLQVYPEKWNVLLKEKLSSIKYEDGKEKQGKNIELYTRVNFKFSFNKYENVKRECNKSNISVTRIEKEQVKTITGSVVPLSFWNNEEEFYKYGIGFCVKVDGEIVSVAHSSFVHDKHLEIGIETKEGYRANGYAKMASMALIDYCLGNGFEPVWSCRLENASSYYLARSLGFEQTFQLPYYKLCCK